MMLDLINQASFVFHPTFARHALFILININIIDIKTYTS